MSVANCRVCGRPFRTEPKALYKDMPCAAQRLPDQAALATERGADLALMECSGCGLLQLAGEPVPYYKEVIRASAFSEEMRAYRASQFESFVRKYKLKGKKALELGCGRGEYLSLMRAAGADAYGIEFSDEAVEHCRKAGLKVSKGFMDDSAPKLQDAPFDAFFIMNFLEHLPDPNAALSGAREALTEDGVALVEVPNFDMIRSLGLFTELISDHLLYFTKKTLSFALELNGFEVLSCEETWHDYILTAIAIKREASDLSCFNEARESLQAEMDSFIAKFPEGKVAVWGAGHQALATLALAKLGGKVRYVVDSAPFKQGKFTPATHIPIVPPARLNEDPVDAVVVIAAAYSDEVARTLRKDFDKGLKLAILRGSKLEAVE